MARNKQEKPQARVINQLFGTLESENDIESDVASLGENDEPQPEAVKKPVKRRFFFAFAVFVIIMAFIGCVATVRFVVGITGRLLDNTSLKNEFAKFIFPVVVNDIPPFETVDEIPNSAKITCAVWNILINKDTEQYSGAGAGLTIPEYDVAASCKEIFGAEATIEHTTVGTAEVRFIYDAENHVYSAEKQIRYLTYAPRIVDMSENGGTYTLIVGYLPPTVASVAGISGMDASPEKYMVYTINRWEGRDTLISVSFSDYTPASEDT